MYVHSATFPSYWNLFTFVYKFNLALRGPNDSGLWELAERVPVVILPVALAKDL